jgi:hypothetical protein
LVESHEGSKEGVMKIVLGLALVGMSSVSSGSPVRLECTTQSGEPSKATSYRIILDEEASSAALWDEVLGKPQVIEARFTDTDVTFDWSKPLMQITYRYRIDRTTLEFSRTLVELSGTAERGSCKIVEMPKRQF